MEGRAQFCETVFSSFESFELLLLPTVPVAPFSAEGEGPSWMDGNADLPWIQWTPFTYPFNLTGQPAASVPAGWTEDGLPVGLQIVGQRHADRTVLAASAAWEAAHPWSERRPVL